MFRIKICGITNVPDAVAAVDAGADAIGLNFYENSSRFLSLPGAEEIATATGDSVLRIGVFVNADRMEAAKTRIIAALDAIQLHGDEAPSIVAHIAKKPNDETLASQLEAMARFMPAKQLDEFRRALMQLKNAAVVWARRVGEYGLEPICQELEECKSLGANPVAVLIDATTPGAYGGTGQKAPWNRIAGSSSSLGETPLILAGGLTPDNVAEAIRIVRPHGVDVASGVEIAPGKKDPAKVRDFIAAARAAFDSL